MFKWSNILIGLFIAVSSYFLLSYLGGNNSMFTADVFRANTNIAGDIYTQEQNNTFTINSNFESDPGILSFVMMRDDSKVNINSESIKSEYSANISNLSPNMISIQIPKYKSFGTKNQLAAIPYEGPNGYINISDAKMTYNSGTVDNLAITKLQ